MLSLIESVIEKCEELQNETEFLKTLAGKAKRESKWSDVDPDYTMLKTMAINQATRILEKAQELRDILPST